MKKFIETIKNIFRIEDLRKRILYTLFIILIYRFGAHVVLPGINPGALSAFSSAAQKGLLGMLDLFSGGAFSNASIFALGIMPYITASIVVQLFTLAVPYFQRLAKEGESGRTKINQITRYLTVAVLAVQAPAYITQLTVQFPGAVAPSMLETRILGFSAFAICAFVLLISATLFIMWLGERITDNGIGNGISMIIMIGIIARLPFALKAEFTARITEMNGGPIIFILEIILIYRFGAHVVLPGINPGALSAFSSAAQKGLLGMLDLCSGGAFSNASIFALGIMPYITASIVVQLFTLAVPYFQRLAKEGESGRILTAILT